MAQKLFFKNGRIFTGDDEFSSCFVVSGDKIQHVGDEDDEAFQLAVREGGEVIDLEGRVVVPGFIDSHTHLLFFGLSLQKLDLTWLKSLEQVRDAISRFVKLNPSATRILCRSWHQPSTDGLALTSMLDDLDPRPIFIISLDLHSAWCNTAALSELPLEEMKSKCGKHLTLDELGNPSGLVAETAVVGYVWPHLLGVNTAEDKQVALKAAVKAYTDA